jgi:formylglycine-generating enzyme required for sulfatase activity
MKKQAILLCSISAMLLSAAHALTLDTVTIGDPGNPNDPLTGNLYGGVSYSYNIGKYEVTLNQYTEFLNAVAKTDTYALYNTNMGTDLNSRGISRSGSSGSYSYAVLGDGQRPVTYVSWFDAARFTNWLHNGQPTGLQVAGTTEQGAYTLNGATSGVGFSKGVGAQYWIPSESEWYKAAYYQPAAAGGDADGYWLYPTGSNAVPNSRNGSVSDANSGNFYRSVLPNPDGVNDGYAVTGSTSYSSSQNYLTPVGAYTQADSYYGTFDQGGNVWEWNDAIISSSRGLRGGSWGDGGSALQSSFRYGSGPTGESDSIGFRIASVPEPTVSVSLMLAGGLLLSRRKRPSAL